MRLLGLCYNCGIIGHDQKICKAQRVKSVTDETKDRFGLHLSVLTAKSMASKASMGASWSSSSQPWFSQQEEEGGDENRQRVGEQQRFVCKRGEKAATKDKLCEKGESSYMIQLAAIKSKSIGTDNSSDTSLEGQQSTEGIVPIADHTAYNNRQMGYPLVGNMVFNANKTVMPPSKDNPKHLGTTDVELKMTLTSNGGFIGPNDEGQKKFVMLESPGPILFQLGLGEGGNKYYGLVGGENVTSGKYSFIQSTREYKRTRYLLDSQYGIMGGGSSNPQYFVEFLDEENEEQVLGESKDDLSLMMNKLAYGLQSQLTLKRKGEDKAPIFLEYKENRREGLEDSNLKGKKVARETEKTSTELLMPEEAGRTMPHLQP